MEEVYKADEAKIDVAQDNAAKALDSARPYAESSTTQLTRTISKGRSPVKKAKRECFIHVVHYGLKQSNESDMHYKPLLLSIGPYHRGNDVLQNMEKHKFHYLNVFLSRIKERGSSIDADAWKKVGSKGLDCYVDTFTMSADDFGQCLSLDGVFMLELFRKNLRRKEHGKETSDDVLFSIRWIKPYLARDLLLFENQLPLFVLYELFEMTEETPSEMEFIKLALGYFEFNGRPIRIDMYLGYLLDDIPHLLGLVYNALVEPEMPNQSNKEWESREFIRTAVALQEVGIKFGKKYSERFYDISFIREYGVLRIPRLVIDDNTESFFRNLVAYEQYSEDYSLHQVADYLRVMDRLINSAKDVELLRHCGIIDNRIGDDVKVSNMFNKLCSGVYFDQNEFLYAKIFDQVNEFCKKPWNVRMAKLKNDYFGNPWSVISFLAAATLLVLTMLQTVFTGISTF